MGTEVTQTEEIFLDAPIAEMSADPSVVVPLDPTRVQDLLARTKDQEPQFPIVRVEEGVSGNKFKWEPAVLESVAEQINKDEPVAYLGHIRPEDDRWAFPDPQTIWLRGLTKIENGKKVLYVKGYNLPKAKIRDLIAAGVARSTSWRGKADVRVGRDGVKTPIRFKLESFDWARPGKQAMEARLVAVVAEQTEGSEKVETSEIGKLTLAEVKEHNPSLYELIKREGAGESQTAVAEMEEKVKAAEEAVSLRDKLRELLKVDKADSLFEVVSRFVTDAEKVASDKLFESLDKILGDKIKDDKTRAVIRRLMPVAEMTDLAEDETKLKAKVDEVFNSDEEIREMVARTDNGELRPLTHQSKGRSTEQQLVGVKNTTVRL